MTFRTERERYSVSTLLLLCFNRIAYGESTAITDYKLEEWGKVQVNVNRPDLYPASVLCSLFKMPIIVKGRTSVFLTNSKQSAEKIVRAEEERCVVTSGKVVGHFCFYGLSFPQRSGTSYHPQQTRRTRNGIDSISRYNLYRIATQRAGVFSNATESFPEPQSEIDSTPFHPERLSVPWAIGRQIEQIRASSIRYREKVVNLYGLAEPSNSYFYHLDISQFTQFRGIFLEMAKGARQNKWPTVFRTDKMERSNTFTHTFVSSFVSGAKNRSTFCYLATG
ncbi:unnamed protein product [Nesidiocoris tenuis]|uniref:Uncharacterized protein n=1 Tax=Nesidiocoris tenuis TaxID=355587 RepID=A0A6H5GS24_9HEMI|nr:unnamed protein product [Nesidiocoris tenuis]